MILMVSYCFVRVFPCGFPEKNGQGSWNKSDYSELFLEHVSWVMTFLVFCMCTVYVCVCVFIWLRHLPRSLRIYFYWICRGQEEFDWFCDLLSDAAVGPAAGIVDITLFLTGEIELSQAIRIEPKSKSSIAVLKCSTVLIESSDV